MAAVMFSSLGRTRLLSGSRSIVLGFCGLRRHVPSTPMYGDGDGDENDTDSEDNEEQEIMSILKNRGEAIRLKRIKRMMEPPGPPERRLTWNAMEQIRYLKQELPEEWTVQRLAEGFNVSTDVIKRVLKAKFVPSAARKMKQDAAASKHLGQISLSTTRDQVKLMPASKDPKQQLLGHGKSERKLIVGQSPPLLQSPKTSDVSHVAVRTEGTQIQRHITNTLVPQNALQTLQVAPPPPSQSKAATNEQENPVPCVSVRNDWQSLDEEWDGMVLSDEQLEELAESGLENGMKVVQKGKEFFDGDGNYLYSI